MRELAVQLSYEYPDMFRNREGTGLVMLILTEEASVFIFLLLPEMLQDTHHHWERISNVCREIAGLLFGH